MSFRCLVLAHNGEVPAAIQAIADGIIRPGDSEEEVRRWAMAHRYWEPMRVFIAPGDFWNPQVALLRTYWQHHAPSMRYTIETLPLLADMAGGDDALI